jgi:hypothetical protein
MPKLLMFWVGIVMLSTALSAATQDTGGQLWGSPIEGCRLSLGTDKQQYQFGEPIHLHVMLENTDRDSLTVVEGYWLPYRVEVTAPNLHDAPPTLWSQAEKRGEELGGSARVIKLSKGQTREEDFLSLNRYFDMSLSGKYAIVVNQILPSALDPNGWVTVTSNPIVIDVK